MPDGVIMGANSIAKGDSWWEVLFVVGSESERLTDSEGNVFVVMSEGVDSFIVEIVLKSEGGNREISDTRIARFSSLVLKVD